MEKEDLMGALFDVLDGQYKAYEIHEQTGLSLDRCEEIEVLFNQIKEIYASRGC